MKLTIHLYLVPMSRMREAIPLLPNTPSWRGAQVKKHRDNYFIFTTVSRPALEPTQPPIQRYQGLFPLGGGGSGQDVKLTTHLHLVSRSQNAWSYLHSPICIHGVVLKLKSTFTFTFTTVSRQALGRTQYPIQWVPQALSLRLKRPKREADHSPPSSSEVKNEWSYTSTLQYAFMAWCSV
jgi:hypothetical protein